MLTIFFLKYVIKYFKISSQRYMYTFADHMTGVLWEVIVFQVR